MIADRRIFTLGALGLAACGQSTESAAAPDPRPRSYQLLNQPAPDFSLPKLGGGTASLADYAGRVVILYFGGLWCPDCVVDGANTNRLAQLVAANADVDFLNIHTLNRFGRWGNNERQRTAEYDAQESAAALNAYFAETNYSYPVAFDATRTWAGETYRIEWSPSFMIVDRQGIIRAWRTDLGSRATAEAFFAEARRIAAA